MTSDWTTIGDIADVFDGPHATPKKTDEGPVFLGIGSLNKGSLDLSKSERLSEEDFEKWTKRVTPRVGDVVFSYETRLGEAAIIPDGLCCCLGRRMGLLRPKLDRVLPEYLLYAYLGPDFQGLISARTIHGSTVDRIALKDLPNFPIQIPPVEKQRSIIDVLKGLDDKIELNRQINQTLEQIAQAIFKSWFVDFEPVKAKIEAKATGRDPERAAMCAISGKLEPELDQLSPKHYQQLAATAALFPDELVESELGLIPVGWEHKPAAELAEIGIGKTPPRKEPQWFTEDQNDVRWVSIRDMGASGTFMQKTSEYLTQEAIKRFNVRLVPDNTVLLSFKLTVGRVAITDGEMTTNEAIAHFKIFENLNISSEFIYLYLRSFDYSQLGSTSSIAEAVNSKTIRDIQLLVPSEKCMAYFTKMIAPLFIKIKTKQSESEALATLRNILLPKLLSGEIVLYEAAPQLTEGAS